MHILYAKIVLLWFFLCDVFLRVKNSIHSNTNISCKAHAYNTSFKSFVVIVVDYILGVTHRYRNKFVTTVLYKPLQSDFYEKEDEFIEDIEL